MSTVLVTGGAGAIGSHVVAALVARGDTVVVLDDLSSGHRRLVPDGARLVEGSLLDDDALAAAFDARPDAVVHLAALFANQNSVEHPELDLEVNGRGTLRVLERSRAQGVAKVLMCSSSCIYGSAAVADEDDERRSVDTPYAITKGLLESYGRFYAQHHGLDTVIVRPFNVYGPHEYPGEYRNVIPNFLALAMRGEPLVVTGTGDETRDFTYVEDVARGMLAALDAPLPGGTALNLGSGRSVAIRVLAELVNEIVGSSAGIRFVERRGWDRTPHRLASIARAQELLGYAAETELDDGVRRTHRWLEGEGWPDASS